jgi:hypothetical protein
MKEFENIIKCRERMAAEIESKDIFPRPEQMSVRIFDVLAANSSESNPLTIEDMMRFSNCTTASSFRMAINNLAYVLLTYGYGITIKRKRTNSNTKSYTYWLS